MVLECNKNGYSCVVQLRFCMYGLVYDRLQLVVQVLPHETAFMIFLRVFEACTREQCVQIRMLTWGIWSRRNKWVSERVYGSAFGVKAAATQFLTEMEIGSE